MVTDQKSVVLESRARKRSRSESSSGAREAPIVIGSSSEEDEHLAKRQRSRTPSESRRFRSRSDYLTRRFPSNLQHQTDWIEDASTANTKRDLSSRNEPHTSATRRARDHYPGNLESSVPQVETSQPKNSKSKPKFTPWKPLKFEIVIPLRPTPSPRAHQSQPNAIPATDSRYSPQVHLPESQKLLNGPHADECQNAPQDHHSTQKLSNKSPAVEPQHFKLNTPVTTRFRPNSRSHRVTEREKLLKELKKSTRRAHENLEEVENFVGHTGLSANFIADDLNKRLEELAPTPEREVIREKVKLDWGDDVALPTPSRREIRHPRKQVEEVLTARFRDTACQGLTFKNTPGGRHIHGKFQFVDDYVLSLQIKPPGNTNFGCRCNGACRPQSCPCFTEIATDLSEERHVTVYKRFSRSPGLFVLDDRFIQNELDVNAPHHEIFECNEECTCALDCSNRVVYRGRTVSLEIFQTEKCGFGVRSSTKIVKGQFIDVYLGELITTEELERREAARDPDSASYLFSLDWFKTQDCLHVDGEYFGSPMRFVNHSCDSNARSFTVIHHKADKNIYSLAFFAIRDIPANTEITIDYSPQEEGKNVDISDEEDSERARCHCGAQNCRKWLWREPGRKRKRRKPVKGN